MFSKLSGKTIMLDFTDTKWIDANMCSPLGAVLEHIKKNNNSIYISKPQEPVKKFFINNSFIKLYLAKNDNYINSNIDFKEIAATDNKSFERYLKRTINEVMVKNGMNNDIDALNRVITEVFINVDMHTNSDSVFFSGSYYHKSNVFVLSITNIGKTINEVLLENDLEFKNDFDAIEWSLRKNNSTSKENRTKGLGLYEFIEFGKIVNGEIHIISGTGLLRINSKGDYEKIKLNNKFPGTSFYISCDTKKIPNEVHLSHNTILTLDDILNWG